MHFAALRHKAAKCYNKGMKKNIFKTALLAVLFCLSSVAFAQQKLSAFLPLLQAPTRTAAQNQQVLTLFASSKDPNTVFAAGASLVRIPPASAQEAKLLNIIIKDDNMLKKMFSAVILTAMGSMHPETSSLLQDSIASQDHAVRAYAASAYTILNPQDKNYKEEIINLYIYDPAFAQRAMNLIADDEKEMLKYLKDASKSADSQVRSSAAEWLGDLQTENAAKQLLKMAKSEQDQQAISAIASALAKNKQWTLQDTVNGLKTRYTQPQAATYALALGFMAGSALEPIKQGLSDDNVNIRINSARAAAYMAGVLASPDANLYTLDKAFDIMLLKGLIPQLNAMAKRDKASAQAYAENALKQIAKLM